MFLSLARRSQSLVDQMIAHLDDIERDEEDPSGRRLSSRHSTRMRRNDGNCWCCAARRAHRGGTTASSSTPARRPVRDRALRPGGVGSVDLEALWRPGRSTTSAVARRAFNKHAVSPPDGGRRGQCRRSATSHSTARPRRSGAVPSSPPVNRGSRNATVESPRRRGLAVTGRLASRYGIRSRSGRTRARVRRVRQPPPNIRGPRPRSYDMSAVSNPTARAYPDVRRWRPRLVGVAGPIPVGGTRAAAGGGGLAVHQRTGVAAGRVPAGRDQAPPPAVRRPAEMPIKPQMRAGWSRQRGLDLVAVGYGSRAAIPPPAHVPAARLAVPTSSTTAGFAGRRGVAGGGARTGTADDDDAPGCPSACRRLNSYRWRGGHTAPGDAQRTPADVRSLLSAYHGGVQRGRGTVPPASG